MPACLQPAGVRKGGQSGQRGPRGWRPDTFIEECRICGYDTWEKEEEEEVHKLWINGSKEVILTVLTNPTNASAASGCVGDQQARQQLLYFQVRI